MSRRRYPFACWLIGLALGVGGVAYGQIAPAITSYPADQAIVVGGSVTLSVAATGSAPLSYQWYKNGEPIAGATAADLQIVAAESTDAGLYSVSVANVYGSVPAATSQVIAAGLQNISPTDQIPHDLFVDANGSLWGVGWNRSGQLGNGTTNDLAVPTQVASWVKAVATGDKHSLFVRYDGTLWAMGSNQYGQLGDGSLLDRLTPIQVAVNVVAVVAGANHSLFLKDDGTLWAVGRNQFGQLGDGTMIDRSSPVAVADHVRAIAAGREFCLFVKEDGTLWAMGDNSHGQLGDGTKLNRSSPALVMGGVYAISAGSQHIMILREDGSLWAAGGNGTGWLGDGTFTERDVPVWIANGVIGIGAGADHSYFLRRDGSRWAMGQNYYGQLDGTLGGPTQPNPIPVGSSAVRAMSMGHWHDLLLGNDGTLKQWRWIHSELGGLPIGTLETTFSMGMPRATLLTVTANGPEITSPPRSQAALVGQSATFSVTATDPGPLTYQWRKGGVPIAGATGPSLAIDSVDELDAGMYDVVVSSGLGQTTSAMATLWVRSGPAISRTVGYGNAITLSAEIAGDFIGYQWLHNGAIIVGANSATYSIPAAAAEDAGEYSVVATGINGSILFAAGSISAGPALGSDGVLLGLSTRGWVGTGDDLMITGFWVEGSDPKQVVLRGMGPSMAAQGVSGTVADPRLDLYQSDGVGGSTLLASNDNWENTPANVDLMNAIGLPIPTSNLESVLALNLDPGVYTAHLSGTGNGTGVGLLEAYDADSVLAPDLPKLAAISTRGVVRTDDEVLIGGFIITGTEPKLVLVQAVGPSLEGSGVTGLLDEPRVEIVRGSDQAIVGENDDWEVGNDIADVMAARARAGATPLTTGSRDAAILIYLPPGLYTAVASGANGSTGVALMNIYEVPPE